MAFANILAVGGKRMELSIASMTPGYTDTGNTEDADQDFSSTGATADKEWMARKFTAVNTGKVQFAQVVLGKTGTPVGTIAAYIYSDDGGTPSVPDTQIGGASDAVTATGLSAAAEGATQDFVWGGNEGQDGDGPDVVAGTAYWLVLKTVGYTYSDGVTEIRWRTDANSAVGLNECGKYDSNASPAWSSIGADVGADLVIGSSANFEITSDVDGDTLPNEMGIAGITVKPSIATVYEMSLFARSTRLRADTVLAMRWYEGKLAVQMVDEDAQPRRYIDMGRAGTVYGSIRIHPDSPDSAFGIAINYI